MTDLERALLTALVDAEFWQHQQRPELIDAALVNRLSRRLNRRAAQGKALTIKCPSRLNA